ncbi:uncharacterized protein LACBIDRAFT_308802 [Laccaria bicolor S238N-H82]|uniref:Predicted protein n=1 Tax=Laccaria bicolor (strain S238N-H82 / ATCC MYA-4686) TaxID=486041 RepID=B0CX87_LACBS|nr:uncharacterized protein LACBIDRAFT_308802 [Laccaria bicolor S238N-H82]EDR13630.1 predicted protein [Laccaria bicolor S238N-H82]|eukprot:XP_001876128.1 predicted protein [Laccaria bicolor S238N-H82]
MRRTSHRHWLSGHEQRLTDGTLTHFMHQPPLYTYHHQLMHCSTCACHLACVCHLTCSCQSLRPFGSIPITNGAGTTVTLAPSIAFSSPTT